MICDCKGTIKFGYVQIWRKKKLNNHQSSMENKKITLQSELLRDSYRFVIRAGFKPATPTSVVWYSIQLS